MIRGKRHLAAVAAVLSVAALGALPGAAPARVLNAESILPPGQSGFVSALGLTDGTGSPHLYDQVPLFVGFARKPYGFGQPGDVETPRTGVRIVRDIYGVPDVTGDTELDAWWGAGYAVAQDRLFQLEAFRHATQGRLAELQGKSALADDLVSRRDYYTPAELDRMYEQLPLPFRQRILAYRDGVNQWIRHVQAFPIDLPAEYAATLTALTPWTVRDTISVGVFLARTVPSGDGQELRNLRAVQDSGGPRALDALLPLSIKGQISTIPRRDGLFPQGRRLSAKKAAAAERRSLRFAQTLPKPSGAQVRAASEKAAVAPGMIGQVGGSLMFAVREPGGRALLYNGPELGFSVPELFVELEVHAPGLDVRGVTAPGIPVIGIGHTSDVAWGLTSGLSDEDDLYAEKLVPGHPEQYYFKGKVRQMDCRNEVFHYKSGLTDVLAGKLPQSGQVTRRICRTVHGPVQAVDGNVAYARRYAIWGQELQTLIGIDMLDHAHSIRDVDAAARTVTWNENIMAADSQGNIGYWHPGNVQLRPSRWDQRLPLPGTGEAEWGGLVPPAKMPHVINPEQGWLANWNNIPSQGWTSGDGEASERVTGSLHRVGWLDRLVAGLAKQPSYQGAREAVRQSGSIAQQRPLASTQLQRAARSATGPAAAVLHTILAWDGDYTQTAPDGTVDPGVATWEAFKTAAAARATAPLGKGAARFENSPGTSHAFDITDKEAYALRTLGPGGYRDAAADAAAALAKRFGTDDATRWREPRLLYKWTIQGAGQPPALPFFDRGTFEQLLELGP